MLTVEDIHTYYGNSYVLQGISLQVKEGAVIGIIGRNGMGKTTLMRSIMRFNPPKRGKVIFRDQPLTRMQPFEIARLGISIVPQGRQIFPSLNVTENLLLGIQTKSGGWTLEEIYELFPPLKERAHNPGKLLSGGEQQMLAIGRSLMTNPSLLLMDEPTEGLSPILVKTVGNMIEKMKQRKLSILLVEQKLSFALKHSDFIHILNLGRIVYSSLPKDLEQNHDIQSQYLGV